MLITGASGGIGKAMAQQLDDVAGRLVLVARSGDKLEELARRLEVETRVVVVDLSRRGSVDELTDAVADLEIDVLINNAGVGLGDRFATREEARILGLIELNVVSLALLTRRLLPPMLERGHGAVLNVGSTVGFQGCPFISTYAGSKAFVNNLSESLSGELRGTGVYVGVLCPGTTRTGFFDASGIAKEGLIQFAMDVEVVAADGLAMIERGRVMRISGWMNKLLIGVQRFVPRWFVRRVSLAVFRPQCDQRVEEEETVD